MNIYDEAIKKLIVQNDYEIIFKALERAKKVEELLGLYRENSVVIKADITIKMLEKELEEMK